MNDTNAFPHYVSAGVSAKEISLRVEPEFFPETAVEAILAGQWDDPRLDRAKAVLEELQPAIDRAVISADRYGWRRWPKLSDIRTLPPDARPLLLEMIRFDNEAKLATRLVPIMLAEMRRSLEENNESRFLEVFASVYRLTHLGSAEPAFVPSSRWRILRDQCHGELLLCLREYSVSRDALQSIVDTLTDNDLPHLSTEQLIEGATLFEYASNWNDMHRIAQYPLRDVLKSLLRYPPWRFNPSALWRLRQLSYEQVQRLEERVASAALGLLREQAPNASAPAVSKRYQPLVLDLDAWRRMLLAFLLHEARYRATVAQVYLHRHHAITGAWPDSPDGVVPAVFLIDPITKRPFRYERTVRGVLLSLPLTPQDSPALGLFGSPADLLPESRSSLDDVTWYLEKR